MQFIVIGYDGTDEQALERRLTARQAHLAMAKKMHDSGRWLYAVAMLNDEKKMIGSVIVCDFESRTALDAQWLDNEPYVLGKVWEKIEVVQGQVAPFWDK